jgi:hypothetical protein
MPTFSPSPFVNEKGYEAGCGSPFNLKDFIVETGMPSGIAIVSFANKIRGTTETLIALDDFKPDVVGRVRQILEWRASDVALENNGDDTLVGFKSPGRYERFVEFLNKYKSPYSVITIEENVKYNGMVLYDEMGDRKSAMDPAPFFHKFFAPERGIDLTGNSPFRTQYELGLLGRFDDFQTHPHSGRMIEIFKEGVQRFLNFNIDAALVGVPSDGYDRIRAEIDNDPEKPNYKFEFGDVPDSILDPFVAKIPIEEVEPLVRIHLTT